MSTSSPNSSGVSASGERAEASPPSSGSIGAALESSRSTASVGNVNGSASRSAPAAPASSGSPLSTPPPSPSGSTSAWNGVASPPSSAAAQTETAVPSSISRSSPITPPGAAADQRAGLEHLVDGLERRLGRREVGARGEHQRDVARPPAERVARGGGRLECAEARVRLRREAASDPDAHGD